jgi:hypothetical protein
MELAPIVGAHDLVGVDDRCGPVEALVEHIAHEGARCRVMAAHAWMDVSDELPTVRDGDAPLQDSGRSALVQLTVNHSE